MDYTPAEPAVTPPPFVSSITGAPPRYRNYNALKNTLVVEPKSLTDLPPAVDAVKPNTNSPASLPSELTSSLPSELTPSAPVSSDDSTPVIDAPSPEQQAATEAEAKLQESEKPSVWQRVVKQIPLVGPAIDFYHCAHVVTAKNNAIKDRLQDLNAQVKDEPLSQQEIASIVDYSRNQATCGKDFAKDFGSDVLSLALGSGISGTLLKHAVVSTGLGTGVDYAVQNIDWVPKEVPPATQERHDVQDIKAQTVFRSADKTYLFDSVDGGNTLARSNVKDDKTPAPVLVEQKSAEPTVEAKPSVVPNVSVAQPIGRVSLKSSALTM